MIRGLFHLVLIYLAVSATATVAYCAVQARVNARVRAARKASTVEALEVARVRREFDRIVAATWGADA